MILPHIRSVTTLRPVASFSCPNQVGCLPQPQTNQPPRLPYPRPPVQPLACGGTLWPDSTPVAVPSLPAGGYVMQAVCAPHNAIQVPPCSSRVSRSLHRRALYVVRFFPVVASALLTLLSSHSARCTFVVPNHSLLYRAPTGSPSSAVMRSHQVSLVLPS